MGHAVEQRPGQVRRRAVAGGTVADGTLLLPHIFDELLQRLGRHGGVDREHVRDQHHLRYRDQVLAQVETHVLVERDVGGDRAGGHQQRVAVRRRLRHVGSADVAAGTRPVFHDDLLFQFLAELVGEQARGGIGATPGGKRHDQRDGLFRGPVAGMGGDARKRRAGGNSDVEETSGHGCVSGNGFICADACDQRDRAG